MSHSPSYAYVAKPLATGVATALAFAVVGGAGGGLARVAWQSGIAVVATIAADAVTSGMDNDTLVAPLVSGAVFAAANKALGDGTPLVDLVAVGAAISIGSTFVIDPIARSLGVQ